MILFLTVGGSAPPIQHAIEQNNPQFVVFLCSAGKTGTIEVAEEAARACGVSDERFLIAATEKIDNLQSMHTLIRETHATIASKFERPRIVANYTGGSKSMSAALVLYAFQRGWEIQLQEGVRRDTTKVTKDDLAVLIRLDELKAETILETAKLLADRTDWEGAANFIVTQLTGISNPETRANLRAKLSEYRFLASVDHFALEDAKAMLEDVSPEFKATYASKLGSSMNTIGALENATKNPFSQEEWKRVRKSMSYEAARFMLQGVHAAATRNRYDEAFARLYRATELVAQIRLYKNHGVVTGNVDPSRLPRDWPNPETTSTLALERAYVCLVLFKDPVGEAFRSREAELRDTLQFRNHSILAHGFHPTSKHDWEKRATKFMEWLEATIDLAEK